MIILTDFLTFWTALGNWACNFLMSEPISWFVGILLLLAVAQLFKRITNIS